MQSDSQTLISAIQSQSVPDLPPKPGLIDTARRTCIQIGEDLTATCTRLLDALGRDGITAKQVAPLGPSQYHAAAIRISPDDFLAAVATMQSEGFHPPCALSPARLKVISQTQTALRFVSFNDVTTRISLVFADRPKSILPKALRPQIQDIADIDLPAPLYTPWRIARLIGARLTGRASLGENDFLGTPDALVLPLMEAVGVTADDTVLDLGCGDGRVLIGAVQALGCRGLGVELNAEHARRGRDRVSAAGLDNRISITTGSIEDAPLTEATVIFVFLPHKLTASLMPQILTARQPGARVLVHEQDPLPKSLTPDRSLPVLAENALTVAHIWDGT